jgi:CO/xanthine dehydrogenase Mo-binding subunit
MKQVVSPVGASASERRRRILTGQKVFASDFRPKDLDGWPEQCAHALLLRATVAGRAFIDIDLDRLRLELQPDVLITARDLGVFRNYISKSDVELLVKPGNAIDYVGQPVALLLYSGFTRFRRAAQELREDAGPIVYGPPVGSTTTTIEEELKAWRELHSEGSQGETHFLLDLDSDQSQWTRGKLTRDDRGFSRNDQSDPKSDELFMSLAAEGRGPAVQTTTFTQTVDPAFLEPEAGLAWFDREQADLHLLLGTQSPYGDVEGLRDIFGDEGSSLVKQIRLTVTNIGGGSEAGTNHPSRFISR